MAQLASGEQRLASLKMSHFTESSLVEKLNMLNDTQQCIGVVSHWMVFHRRNAKDCVRIWEQELRKVSPAKKLSFVYLCNDVCQISRKKGTEFLDAFRDVLPRALEHAYRKNPPDVQKKIVRVLDVWKERQVYPEEFVEALIARLGQNSKREEKVEKPGPQLVPQPKSQENSQESKKRSRRESELFTVLSELEESDSQIDKVYKQTEQICSALASSFKANKEANELGQDPGRFEPFLLNLKQHLEGQIDKRSQFRESLASLANEQSDHITRDRAKLYRLVDLIQDIRHLKREYDKRLPQYSSRGQVEAPPPTSRKISDPRAHDGGKKVQPRPPERGK
ncbi:uncharacterized protein VTP21DRAFT_3562 [Calcarisporiella thermophila]|uniref:uncharacterized protein n=1 Tax=Calcarisporiella thermophila TaxID=911321 RepID=UPI003742F8F2